VCGCTVLLLPEALMNLYTVRSCSTLTCTYCMIDICSITYIYMGMDGKEEA